MQNKFTRFLFYFLIFLILFQVFSGNRRDTETKEGDIIVHSEDKLVLGKEVIISIENRTSGALIVENPCPQNPLRIDYYQNGEWAEKKATIKEKECSNLPNEWKLEAGDTTRISLGLWDYDLFDQTGLYRISFETTLDDDSKSYFTEIDIVKPGVIRRTWSNFLYKPIFNTLIFFISTLPNHSLGWAIILLTMAIKLILLIPNQKALKAQRQLQLIQPQLDALKLKYKDDPQRLASETMEIWKKHKVNPMGSCLPMLIQFPILIALFYVVRDGLGSIDPNLLYESLRDFDISMVNPIFLGVMDLTKVSIIVLPITVAGLQFFQIRLSLNKSKAITKESSNAGLPMMNKMMQYFLPVMIAVFTATLPAAVGFYWGTSTLFAIGQQIVVNRSKD